MLDFTFVFASISDELNRKFFRTLGQRNRVCLCLLTWSCVFLLTCLSSIVLYAALQSTKDSRATRRSCKSGDCIDYNEKWEWWYCEEEGGGGGGWRRLSSLLKRWGREGDHGDHDILYTLSYFTTSISNGMNFISTMISIYIITYNSFHLAKDMKGDVLIAKWNVLRNRNVTVLASISLPSAVVFFFRFSFLFLSFNSILVLAKQSTKFSVHFIIKNLRGRGLLETKVELRDYV